jgi:hypothetical protein
MEPSRSAVLTLCKNSGDQRATRTVYQGSLNAGRYRGLHCYYRQPKITRAQFAYLAIYLVLIGNIAAEEARTERLFHGSDERLYNLQFGKIRLPDSEPAVVIYIEPLRPTTTARWKNRR